MILELSIVTGRPLDELRGLELDELATMLDIAEDFGRRA